MKIYSYPQNPQSPTPLLNGLWNLQYWHKNLTFNTRTAGVAISLQRPAAVILTASPKTQFYLVYALCGCNLSVEQIIR